MKQDRIELRVNQRERERFLEAALFSGMSLSAFIRHVTLEKSEDILKNKDTLTLSNRDRDLFLEALEHPPKPNKRLQQAFRKYQKLKNKNVPSPKKRSLSTKKLSKSNCVRNYSSD